MPAQVPAREQEVMEQEVQVVVQQGGQQYILPAGQELHYGEGVQYILPNGDRFILQSPLKVQEQEDQGDQEEQEEQEDQEFKFITLEGVKNGAVIDCVSKNISYTETVLGGGNESNTENVISTLLLPTSVSEIEPKVKNVSCSYCSYTTNRRSHLNEHYRIIHLKVKVICDLCGKEFSNINQHMRVVHKVLRSGILEKKECQECQKEFFDLTKHMAKAHNLKYIYDYDCNICNMKFKSKFILQRHMQRRHGDKSTCGECGKKVSNLDVHIKKVHRARAQEAAVSCPNCSCSFLTSSDLTNHLTSCRGSVLEVTENQVEEEQITSNQEQELPVALLDRDESNEENLQNLEESDPNGNLIKAEERLIQDSTQSLSQNFIVCVGDLEDSSETNPEIERKPGRKGLVSCTMCGEMCKDLQKHVERYHTEKGIKVKGATMYQCELCGYATNRTTNYNMHYKMVHLKSRTMCEQCGKEYSNINQHMRVVHKALKSGLTEKQPCSQCGNQYYGECKSC